MTTHRRLNFRTMLLLMWTSLCAWPVTGVCAAQSEPASSHPEFVAAVDALGGDTLYQLMESVHFEAIVGGVPGLVDVSISLEFDGHADGRSRATVFMHREPREMLDRASVSIDPALGVLDADYTPRMSFTSDEHTALLESGCDGRTSWTWSPQSGYDVAPPSTSLDTFGYPLFRLFEIATEQGDAKTGGEWMVRASRASKIDGRTVIVHSLSQTEAEDEVLEVALDATTHRPIRFREPDGRQSTILEWTDAEGILLPSKVQIDGPQPLTLTLAHVRLNDIDETRLETPAALQRQIIDAGG